MNADVKAFLSACGSNKNLKNIAIDMAKILMNARQGLANPETKASTEAYIALLNIQSTAENWLRNHAIDSGTTLFNAEELWVELGDYRALYCR